MAPVKFDDLPKAAADVLNEDYQVSGFQFKSKQKASWAGAVSTTTVDLFPAKAVGGVVTPAKLSWKLPKAFGRDGIVVDKLEVDSLGRFKFELSADKAAHGVADLKIEAKTDLKAFEKATAAVTFTGVKDTQIKVETKPLDPTDFSLEVTRAIEKITLGVKLGASTLTQPELGLKAEYGPVIASLLAKDSYSNFSANALFKARDDLKIAASIASAKGKQSWALGAAHVPCKGTLMKGKVNNAGLISVSVKRDVVGGFTVVAGGTYNSAKGDISYGASLSVE